MTWNFFFPLSLFFLSCSIHERKIGFSSVLIVELIVWHFCDGLIYVILANSFNLYFIVFIHQFILSVPSRRKPFKFIWLEQFYAFNHFGGLNEIKLFNMTKNFFLCWPYDFEIHWKVWFVINLLKRVISITKRQ